MGFCKIPPAFCFSIVCLNSPAGVWLRLIRIRSFASDIINILCRWPHDLPVGRIILCYTTHNLLISNTILVIAKNMPYPILRKYWHPILAAQLCIAKEALGAWRGAAARARLQGQMAGLLTWPRVLNQRRAVQRSCRVSPEYLEGLLQPVDQTSRRPYH